MCALVLLSHDEGPSIDSSEWARQTRDILAGCFPDRLT